MVKSRGTFASFCAFVVGATLSLLVIFNNLSNQNLTFNHVLHRRPISVRTLIVSKHKEKLTYINNTTPLPQGVDSPSLLIPFVITLCIENGTDPEDWQRKRKWTRQAEQLRVMLASLLFFSSSPRWRIVCLTDTWDTYYKIVNQTSLWPKIQRERLILERRQLFLPEHSFLQMWRPCCWAKMFLARLLPDLDFVVYLDTDFLFVGPAEHIWRQIGLMDEVQMVAYGPEPWYGHENTSRRLAGKLGINTGISLMNLTRARNLPEGDYGELLLREFNSTISPRHDQDVANSFLSKNSKLLMELSPRFNFNPAICTEGVACQECLTQGIVALHGSDASFYKFVDSKIQVVYAIMKDMSERLLTSAKRLLVKLKAQLQLVGVNSKIVQACENYTGFDDMILFHLYKLL